MIRLIIKCEDCNLVWYTDKNGVVHTEAHHHFSVTLTGVFFFLILSSSEYIFEYGINRLNNNKIPTKRYTYLKKKNYTQGYTYLFEYESMKRILIIYLFFHSLVFIEFFIWSVWNSFFWTEKKNAINRPQHEIFILTSEWPCQCPYIC